MENGSTSHKMHSHLNNSAYTSRVKEGDISTFDGTFTDNIIGQEGFEQKRDWDDHRKKNNDAREKAAEDAKNGGGSKEDEEEKEAAEEADEKARPLWAIPKNEHIGVKVDDSESVRE